MSRRVIVVDAPDTELFEQAIFIVRNDALSREGVSAQQLVEEACRVARSYERSRARPITLRDRFRPFLWAAAGAGSIALLWLSVALLSG